MHIVVCIKQVPESRDVEMDPVTGSLLREGAASVMNPFDLYGLEAALALKERYGGQVTVITMGPPQAEEVIREAYMMGADRGIMLSDRAFAGADTLATAYTLAQGIARIESVDLIICGLQTTDGDTAQVGPGMAEFLDLPHESAVAAIRGVDEAGLWVQRDMGSTIMELSLQLPCLITVTKTVNQPRLLSFRRKLATKDWPVEIWGRSHIAAETGGYFGLDMSPTQVERMFPPESHSHHERWEGSAEELSQRLQQWLMDEKFIEQEVEPWASKS